MNTFDEIHMLYCCSILFFAYVCIVSELKEDRSFSTKFMYKNSQEKYHREPELFDRTNGSGAETVA